jgi:hypothetical protein
MIALPKGSHGIIITRNNYTYYSVYGKDVGRIMSVIYFEMREKDILFENYNMLKYMKDAAYSVFMFYKRGRFSEYIRRQLINIIEDGSSDDVIYIINDDFDDFIRNFSELGNDLSLLRKREIRRTTWKCSCLKDVVNAIRETKTPKLYALMFKLITKRDTELHDIYDVFKYEQEVTKEV